jgi:hypothetical protein
MQEISSTMTSTPRRRQVTLTPEADQGTGTVTGVDVVAVEPIAFTARTATSYVLPGIHVPPAESTVS